MKIRALVHIAGTGFSLVPGDVTDQFPDADAMRLVAKNAAVVVEAAPETEKAVEFVPALETRVVHTEAIRKPPRLHKGKRG